MWSAFFVGLARAVAFSPLALVLWLVNFGFGAIFAFASGYWLYLALDGSLATRTLLKDLDPNVLLDLYVHHGGDARLLLFVAILLYVAYLLLWFCLHPMIIFAVRGEIRAGLGEAWLQGVQTAPVMAKLFAIAVVPMAALSVLTGGAVWGGLRLTVSSPMPFLWSYIVLAGLLVWIPGMVFLVAVHDHARIRACASGQGAWSAYRWALGFVLRGGEWAFVLALLLQGASLALWLAYQWGNLSLPVNAALGVTGSLLLGQGFLLVRMWVRVWFFAAQNEIQP